MCQCPCVCVRGVGGWSVCACAYVYAPRIAFRDTILHFINTLIIIIPFFNIMFLPSLLLVFWPYPFALSVFVFFFFFSLSLSLSFFFFCWWPILLTFFWNSPVCFLNPFAAILAAPSLGKPPIKLPDLKSLSRLVTVPSNILLASVFACSFQFSAWKFYRLGKWRG